VAIETAVSTSNYQTFDKFPIVSSTTSEQHNIKLSVKKGKNAGTWETLSVPPENLHDQNVTDRVFCSQFLPFYEI
jgi:hypothetical protein